MATIKPEVSDNDAIYCMALHTAFYLVDRDVGKIADGYRPCSICHITRGSSDNCAVREMAALCEKVGVNTRCYAHGAPNNQINLHDSEGEWETILEHYYKWDNT